MADFDPTLRGALAQEAALRSTDARGTERIGGLVVDPARSAAAGEHVVRCGCGRRVPVSMLRDLRPLARPALPAFCCDACDEGMQRRGLYRASDVAAAHAAPAALVAKLRARERAAVAAPVDTPAGLAAPMLAVAAAAPTRSPARWWERVGAWVQAAWARLRRRPAPT